MMSIQPLHYYISTVAQLLFPQPKAAHNLSALARAPHIEENYFFALFNYHNEKVQTLVKYLKTHNDRDLARRLADLMYDQLFEYLNDEYLYQHPNNPIIIPMPISAKSKRARGFNQVRALCGHLSKKLNARLCCPKDIIKFETKKQALLAQSQRRANVAGCFYIPNHSFFKHKYCIIVDDLITTGATMQELRSQLLIAGARKVIGISIAH